MVNEPDDPEHVLGQWRSGRASKRDLYSAVRDVMRQAARRAIWQMSNERPDEHAVEDAVFVAFNELWEIDPSEVKTLVGLAARIAYRRGQDEARRRLAGEKAARALTERIGDRLFADLDEEAAERRAQLVADLRDCMAGLTSAQRDVIEQTYMHGVPLSDWANGKGTSYEAARRQRERGLSSVRRCVEGKRRDPGADGRDEG